MDDPWDDPDWKVYVTHVRTTLVSMIENSAIGVSIVPTNPEDVDVKFAVELGLMIMLNKPILLLVGIGTELPPKLRAVADEIVFGDPEDPDTREHLIEAMGRMIPDMGNDDGN